MRKPSKRSLAIADTLINIIADDAAYSRDDIQDEIVMKLDQAELFAKIKETSACLKLASSIGLRRAIGAEELRRMIVSSIKSREMIEWVLHIPEVLPSLNQTLRRHWGRRRLDRNRLSKFIWSERLKKEIPAAKGKRHIVIERSAVRMLDYDNACGGAKDFIDELRAAKLIVDDTDEFLTMECINIKLVKGEHPHTKVRIWDVTE